MLLPKRVKYRRVQRGRMKGKALRGNKAVSYTHLDVYKRQVLAVGHCPLSAPGGFLRLSQV